jgi:hypothetical protein
VKRGDGLLHLPAQSFELGGVLVDRADKFLADHPKSQDELRRIFTLKLATVREGEEPTRRRALRSEFSEEEWRLVSELADHPNRLLVTATPEGGETYAEVAHEAIFRRWDKLRDWIAAEREFLAWRTGLEAARRAWQATPDSSKDGALLMGVALAQAQSWLGKRSKDLSVADSNFIDQSAKRESKARARARRLHALILAMSTVMVLLLFGWYFNWLNVQSWGLLTDLRNGHVFELHDYSIGIGRRAEVNKITVPDAFQLSAVHLFISRDRFAVDAGSRHGTTVNARFLRYRRIEDGDIIALAGAAVFRFRALRPRLLPALWREELKSLPPTEGTWALLIDGKSRQTIALAKHEYSLSAGAEGAVTLTNLTNDTNAERLLFIMRPTDPDTDIIIYNVAPPGLFLTGMTKSEDRYLSVKIPRGPVQLSSFVRSLPQQQQTKNVSRGAEYISKVTFCFKQAEQSGDPVEMEPDEDINCDVGPLQIVLRRE